MDVTATRHIAAQPGQVAKVMFDPARDPEWIGGAWSTDLPAGDPLKVGAKVTRHGGFMGRNSHGRPRSPVTNRTASCT